MPLQPDQRTEAWDDFVSPYERIFEPLTDAFASQVFDLLGPLGGLKLIDIACGPGGAALIAARRGADVLAADAATAMVRRAGARAEPGLRLATQVMDAGGLACPDASMDLAYSGFGVVLLPDPAVALREIRRVLRRGGRAAIVTWTEPQNYALAALLRAAAETIRGPAVPPSDLPAQLRYLDPAAFRQLLAAAGFADPAIHRLEARLQAASVPTLLGSLDFAPGMAATLDAFGADRGAILADLTAKLTERFGDGPVALRAVAHVAIACRPNEP